MSQDDVQTASFYRLVDVLVEAGHFHHDLRFDRPEAIEERVDLFRPRENAR